MPIDLRKIEVPVFFLATQGGPHRALPSVYTATQLFGGPKTFILAGSGHIAGIINPPASEKYGYWSSPRLPADPQKWLAGAKFQEGSWWPDWGRWLARKAGKKVPARQPGDGQLSPLEDAPGSYVKVRASE